MDDFSGLYNLIDSINSCDEQNNINNQNYKATCEYCGSSEFYFDTHIAKSICQQCGAINENYNCSIKVEENVTFEPLRSKGITNPFIRTSQNWDNIPYTKRNLKLTEKFIKKKCKELNLNKYVYDEVIILYKQVILQHYEELKQLKISRGNNKKGLIAACTYYACKNTNFIQTPRAIAKVYNIATSCLNNGCKQFLKYVPKSKIKINIKASKPTDFIDSMVYYFHIEDTEDFTKYIKKIEDNNLITTHRPDTIVLAATINYWIYHSNELKSLPEDKLKSKIKLTAKKRDNNSGTIIMQLCQTLHKYDDFLFNDGILNKNNNENKNLINITEKLNKINALNPNDFDNLNNIDIHKIILSKNETIFNNNFVRVLKYF